MERESKKPQSFYSLTIEELEKLIAYHTEVLALMKKESDWRKENENREQ